MTLSARLALAALLVVLHAGAVRAEPPMERVTRSGFSMDMPHWLVDTDRDSGADGEHIRVWGRTSVDVRWGHDPDVAVARLDAFNAVLDRAFSLTQVERRVERPPGQLRLFRVHLGKAGWTAVTQVACHDFGTLVYVSVVAEERDQAQSLHDAMLATFECRRVDAPEAGEMWPSSDLSDAFGMYEGLGSPLLVHPDGRWMLVVTMDRDSVSLVATNPELARQAFRVYGLALKDSWELQTAATELRNLSGQAFSWDLAGSKLGAISASAFECGQDATGYLVFTGNFQRTSDTDALEALSARVGCPDPDLPPVTLRRSACDVGVLQFCSE